MFFSQKYGIITIPKTKYVMRIFKRKTLPYWRHLLNSPLSLGADTMGHGWARAPPPLLVGGLSKYTFKKKVPPPLSEPFRRLCPWALLVLPISEPPISSININSYCGSILFRIKLYYRPFNYEMSIVYTAIQFKWTKATWRQYRSWRSLHCTSN